MSDDFSRTFTDKQGRTIIIRVDDDDGGRLTTAHHEGRQVGSFEVWDSEDGPLAKFADVIEGYRNASIGIELMRDAFKYHGLMTPPPFNPMGSDNPMTTDGIRLMRAGQKRDWIAEFPDWDQPDPPECL
jgi:hypothetical protein